jgi:cystathionine beta-lyase
MRALGIPGKEVDDKLRSVGKVWLDEGPMFGRGGEGYQRLNLACPRSILEEATKRMARALA